jgi:hypothetical protein
MQTDLISILGLLNVSLSDLNEEKSIGCRCVSPPAVLRVKDTDVGRSEVLVTSFCKEFPNYHCNNIINDTQ